MENIAITGNCDYVKESTVLYSIRKIYDKYGTTATILSGGEERGPEYWAKKYSIEMGMTFLEYNPSYTGYRVYSAMDREYYGKSYHLSHLYDRYRHMLYKADKLIFFNVSNFRLKKELLYLLELAKKLKIKTIIIQ